MCCVMVLMGFNWLRSTMEFVHIKISQNLKIYMIFHDLQPIELIAS
jgi:hypothetical protein